MENSFLQAVNDFKTKANLTDEELQYFRFTTLDEVYRTLHSIQQEQRDKKRQLHINRLQPFLTSMIEYGKVVEVFLNVSNFLALVWGPLKFLLMTVSKFSDAFSSLMDIYEQIGQQIPVLRSYEEQFSSEPHMKSIFVMIYEDILNFHAVSLRYFRQRVWKQIFKASFKAFKSEIIHIKDNLVRHNQLLQAQASLYEFESLRSLRATEEARFQIQQNEETQRRRKTVLDWLSSPDTEAVYERHEAERSWSPDSCGWILRDPRFCHWFDPICCQTPLLWLNGKPGSGKSVLASKIIEECRKLDNFSTCFFYFSYADIQRLGFLPMARSLLSQLLVQEPSLSLHFHEKLLSNNSPTISSMKLAMELLEVALRSRKTYVIVDGIDECERNQRKEICSWFRSIVENLPADQQDEIRCLFISQDDGAARKDLFEVPEMEITSQDNGDDIENFSKRQNKLIEEKFGSLDGWGVDLVKVTVARSQGGFLGIFIFARAVFEELYEQPSKDALLSQWNEQAFPADLEAIYDRILTRLMNHKAKRKWEATKRLLSWISVCKRPLRWFELQAAISIDLDEETINEDGSRLVNTAKELFSSFVHVGKDETVEFIHSTAKDFFQKRNLVATEEAEFDLCNLCLSYLTFDDFRLPIKEGEFKTALLSGRYGFYDYAVACWAPHLLAYLAEIGSAKIDHKDLETTIEVFLEWHQSCHEPYDVGKTVRKELEQLRDISCYKKLAQAVVWSKKQLLIDAYGDKKQDNVLDFHTVTRDTRFILETAAETDQDPVDSPLDCYYGLLKFKCPRIYCQYFFKGFRSRREREEHLQRHERAYICTEEGCPKATSGYTSRKDLDRHLLDEHRISEVEDDFPDLSSLNIGTSHRALFATPNRCHFCGTNFSNRAALMEHRKIHPEVQGHTCTTCGKAFEHKYVLKNHTKIHSGIKDHVCYGSLENGGTWGCNKAFTHKQGLRKHMKSEKGRRCIRILLEEEITYRAQGRNRNQIAAPGEEESRQLALQVANILR